MHLWFALVSLLTFLTTLFALVLAVQLYALLKTGAIGSTWRIVTLATVCFGVGQIFRFARLWDLMAPTPSRYGTHVADFVFIILLAWALWVQRQAFYRPEHYRFTSRDAERGYPSRFERRASGVAGAEEFDDDLPDEDNPLADE